MKRSITRPIAYVFLVLTFILGLAWYNNISMALQWDPVDGHDKVYQGPISWLNWSAVDFSTATTLIPFFGCLLITAGLFRTANAKKDSDVSGYFPFFRSYNSITVALGLIGTVWGLIMIGYYDAAKVKMADLILCLRTALYSTLLALVWVFLFVIPIGSIMRWWYRKVSGYVDTGPEKILTGVKDQLVQLSSSLGAVNRRVDEFNAQLPAAKNNLEGISGAVDNLKEGIGNVVSGAMDTLKSIKSTLQAQLRVADEQSKAAVNQQNVAQTQQNAIHRLTGRVNSLEQQRKDAEARAENAEAKLATIKKTLT